MFRLCSEERHSTHQPRGPTLAAVCTQTAASGPWNPLDRSSLVGSRSQNDSQGLVRSILHIESFGNRKVILEYGFFFFKSQRSRFGCPQPRLSDRAVTFPPPSSRRKVTIPFLPPSAFSAYLPVKRNFPLNSRRLSQLSNTAAWNGLIHQDPRPPRVSWATWERKVSMLGPEQEHEGEAPDSSQVPQQGEQRSASTCRRYPTSLRAAAKGAPRAAQGASN